MMTESQPPGDQRSLSTLKTRLETASFEPEPSYSLEHAINSLGFGRFQWYLMFLCGVGYFAEITELVVLSFVIKKVGDEFGLGYIEESMLGSMSFVGMSIGSYFWGRNSDKFGRKKAFLITIWITFAFGLVSAFAPNYWFLLACRFFAGFGIGGMLPVDFTVFLEFLPKDNRGMAIVAVDAIGIVPAMLFSAGASYLLLDVSWRWVFVVTSIPTGLMALLRRNVPESPRYLLAQGEIEETEAVLQQVAEMNGKALPPGKLSRLEVDLSASAQDAHAFQPLLESAYKPTTLRLWGLWFFLQFASSGIVLWLPTILQTQFDLSDQRTSRDLLYGVLGQAPGLLLAAFLVERSRRYSLALFLICAAATTIGLMFVTSEQEAIGVSIAVRFFMEPGFALLYTVSVESYPTEFRASGLGVAQIFDHIAGIMSPYLFAVMGGNSSMTLLTYAIAFVCGSYCAVTLPFDTAHAALQDVGEHDHARPKLRSTSRGSEDKQSLLIPSSRGVATGDLYQSIHHSDDEEHGRPHFNHQHHEGDRHHRHFEHADGEEETSPLHTSDAAANGDTT